MRYVVDTNVFNLIADGRLSRKHLPAEAELVATYVQVQEINRTKDEKRREHLFLTFARIEPRMVPTSSLIWGKTPWGQGAWGVGEEFQQIRAELDRRNGSKANNVDDALIAETALKNGYGLITADRDLAEVARERLTNVLQITL